MANRLKSIFLSGLFLLSAFHLFSQSQGGQWTWMKGQNISPVGVYGTQGVSSPLNQPPGLTQSLAWTDSNGKFWLYGGISSGSNCQADLWKFDPITNEWTWVNGPGLTSGGYTAIYGTQGIADPGNTPGSRRSALTWVDNNGNLWLYGGYGGTTAIGTYSDLWKYEISTNLWTWVKGPTTPNYNGNYGVLGVSNATNNPPSRIEGASWVDNNGDFWMFGGRQTPFGSCNQSTGVSNFLNDLWKYSVTTNQWTWMNGTIAGTLDFGNRGTMGVPSSTTRPSQRMVIHQWKDNAGNLWMYGGQGTYEDIPNGISYCGGMNINEMWKYDISTNQWTWMNGITSNNYIAGSMGASCAFNTSNHPSQRLDLGNGIVWTDNCGNFWFYGGNSINSTVGNDLSVLWRFDPNTNQWAWLGNQSSSSSFGTQGVSTTSNQPPQRLGGVGWTDLNGNLWMGLGNGSTGITNDVWKFAPDYCNCVSCFVLNMDVTASSPSICAGDSVTFTASGATNYTWSPATGLSATTGSAVNASPAVTTTYTVIGTTGPCMADTTTITVVVNNQQDTDFQYDGPYCQIDADPVPIFMLGSSAGTFSAPSGLVFVSAATGEVDLSASTPGTYTVTNTIPASGSCAASSSTATITINTFQDASFSYSNGSYCQTIGTTLPTITGVSGGTFSATPSGLIIDTSTGSIDLSSPANTYVVSYTTSGSCGDTETFTVTIGTGSTANFSYSGPYCSNDIDPIPTLNPGSSSGTFTSTPAGLVFVSSVTGEVDLSASTPGNYTITNTVSASGSCPGSSATATITINALQNASFGYPNNSYCQSQVTATPIINGTTGGTFTVTPAGLIIDDATGEIDLSSPAGSYTITYTTPGPCAASSSQIVQIANSFFINVSSDVICEGEVATLIATPSVPGGTYSWNPGGQSLSSIDVSPTQTTNYTVSYTLNGCTASASGTITVNASPNAQISTPYTTISLGETIFLNAGSADNYDWNTGQSTQTISVSPEENTTYCVVVTDNGCSDSACIDIVIGCESVIYAPNCITANGDLVNDDFIVEGDCLSEYHLMIFNRWGELIFETFDITDSWNGTYKGQLVSDGVYTYLIVARGIDNQFHDLHGFVTVIK